MRNLEVGGGDEPHEESTSLDVTNSGFKIAVIKRKQRSMALDHQHWMVTVALVTSSLTAFIANLLLLLVFCKRRGLRTISNRFTINLLFTNLLSSILLIPLLVVDQQSSPKNQTGGLPISNYEVRSFFHIQNISSPREIVFQETKDEIFQSSVFEKSEEIISDNFLMTYLDSNRSEDENVTAITKLSVFDSESENFNFVLCYMAQCTVGLICTASILSVLLIGIDQYFAVIHSLRYYSYIDKFRSSVLIIGSWMISVLFGIFAALTQSDSNVWQFCVQNKNDTTNYLHSKSINSIYAFIYFIFIILTPFLAICIIYVCIYTAARNNSERMRNTTNGHNIDSFMQIRSKNRAPSESRLDLKSKEDKEKQRESVPKTGLIKVQSAPNFTNLVSLEEERPPTRESFHPPVKRTLSDRVGFITNLKYKISNASVFKYREETRAAKISFLVILMVLICYLPYGLAVILNCHVVKITIPPSYNFISLVLLVFANIISPFLFVYRNRRIRRELLKFLKITPAKNNSSWTNKRSNSILPTVVTQNNLIEEECERTEVGTSGQPFLNNSCEVPQVVVSCKVEIEKPEKHSILKRVCSGKNWQNYKKCSFITVPESCWQTESARGSFSSASTQSSLEE